MQPITSSKYNVTGLQWQFAKVHGVVAVETTK